MRWALLPLLIKYRAYGDNPIQAAAVLQKNRFNIPTFIHFQKDDVVISTRNDYLLYNYLKGPRTYITIGQEGSHLHLGRELSRELQSFYKFYRNAYYKNSSISLSFLQNAQPDSKKLQKEFADIHIFQRAGIINYTDPQGLPAWQENLKNYSIKTIEKKLGYDPQIRIYSGKDSRVENNKSVTVYVHGLGENAQTVIPYYKINSFVLPGTVVTFDFPDAIPGSFISNFKKLNLAQASDIATLSCILKILDECGLDVIHLYGTSRGGAAIVNTLSRLCSYSMYHDFFKQLSLSQEQVERIIRKIKAGTIILNVSLVDSNAVAKSWFRFLGPTIINYVVPRFTVHKSSEDQAINGAHILQSKDFKILVHFEYKDEIVGNSTDALFYKTIMGKNTNLVLADDGGHLHNGYTLGRAIQAFRKKYGGAYYNLPDLIHDGDKLLAKSPSEPAKVDIFVGDTYREFEKLRKQKKK